MFLAFQCLALLQFLLVIFLSMLYFPNTMYYTITLLCLSVIFMFYLASYFTLSILLFLAVVIVYVGAMMVLIGYICAISPNVSFSSGYRPYTLPFF